MLTPSLRSSDVPPASNSVQFAAHKAKLIHGDFILSFGGSLATFFTKLYLSYLATNDSDEIDQALEERKPTLLGMKRWVDFLELEVKDMAGDIQAAYTEAKTMLKEMEAAMEILDNFSVASMLGRSEFEDCVKDGHIVW